MTPKEKATELYNKFFKCKNESGDYFVIPISEDAKQCALICVDEILSGCCTYVSNKDAKWITDEETSEYWQEVKQEIINRK